jgi:ribosomal protein S21
VLFVPIIIKAKGDDHTGDLIKKFKKIIAATNIIQVVKDRKYYMKPSEVRTVRQNELRRMKKRLRSLKKMKNIPAPKIPKRPVRFEKRSYGE